VLERYATGIVGAQLAVGLPALLEIPNANPTLGSEDLLAWEAGQRVEVSKTFSFDLSGFYQRYHHLITLDPGVPTLMLKPVPYLLVPLTQRNSARGDTLGGELAVNWLPHPRLQISGGYSWLGMRLYNAASVVGNSPTNQLQMRASFDLTRTLEVDGAGYMTGQVAMFNIPSYWRADARLAWHPRRSVEFAVNGQNLTSAEHPEYFSYRLAGIALIPRSVFGSVTWMR
jgi:iron complex outermembrane receptor protein